MPPTHRATFIYPAVDHVGAGRPLFFRRSQPETEHSRPLNKLAAAIASSRSPGLVLAIDHGRPTIIMRHSGLYVFGLSPRLGPVSSAINNVSALTALVRSYFPWSLANGWSEGYSLWWIVGPS